MTQDANAATDSIEVQKDTATTSPVQTADGTPPVTPAGVQPPEGLTPVTQGQPEPEDQPEGVTDPSAPGGADNPQPASDPDPRTLDADGNQVPDYFAAPETPANHDPSVHAMQQNALQKVGTGVFAKMEHVIGAVARYAHQHPELERVFVQGLLDELTKIEMA